MKSYREILRDINEDPTMRVAWQRLKWTLGLFAIGLIVPLAYLLPDLPEQRKIETFRRHYVRAESVVKEVLELDQPQEHLSTQQLQDRFSKSFFDSFLARYAEATLLVNGELVWEGRDIKPPRWLESFFVGYTTKPEIFSAPLHPFPLLFSHSTETGAQDVEFLIQAKRIPYGKEIILLLFDISLLLLALIIGFRASLQVGLESLRTIARQRHFLSAVSHELKTPLAGIRLFSAMLRQGRFNTPESQKACADYISTQSQRLEAVVENILLMADNESRPETQLLDSREIFTEIKALLKNLEPILEEKGASLALEENQFAQTEDRYMVQLESLKICLSNLIDNAAKFGGLESSVPRIIVRLSCQESALTIQVQDSGPGIPDSEHESIFEIFVRGNKARSEQVPGVGLGLALCRRLMQEMHGKLSLIPSEMGACFEIRLNAQKQISDCHWILRLPTRLKDFANSLLLSAAK